MKQKGKKETEPDTFKVTEPLETYFKSPKFLMSFKRISFSSPEEQEEANRMFSASLTPLQRMEYLYILNQAFLSDKIMNLPNRYNTLYFD